MKRFIRIRCPLCGQNNAETVYRRFHETGSAVLGRLEVENALCRNCGFMYVNPRLTKEALSAYYSRESAASGATFHAVTEGSRHARLTSERTAFVLKSIAAIRGGNAGLLLDIGCSTGDLLSALHSTGWSLLGLEPSGYAAAIASKRGLEVIHADLDSSDLPKEIFDAVSCISVLEHMYDIEAAMSMIADIIKPDGLLFIEVPDSQKPVAQIAEFFSFEHLSHFTRGTLTRFLSNFGFKVITFDTDVSVPNIRICAEKRAGGEASGGPVASDREELRAALLDYKKAREKMGKGIAERFAKLTARWEKNSARVAIFGAGMHTRFLLELVDFKDCIVCIIDSDPKKTGTRFLRWEVYGPDAIEKLKLDAVVISSKAYQEEIYATIVHYQETRGIEIIRCYALTE